MADTFDNVRMLLIDNYDSFTYNLVQAFAAQGAEVMVYRNDAITVDEAVALEPTHLVISPGPGRPCMSRAPEPRAAFRRRHRACRAADAWQDFDGET
jgi:anthranilate/para-aminobenzoate synthase component II